MLIRPARPADVAELARTHLAAWRGAYRGIMPDSLLDGLSEQTFAATWTRRLADMPRSTLLAVDDGAVIGFAAGGPSRDSDAVPLRTGELYALYLLPDRWRTGAGWRLWSGIRQWLLVEEFAEVTLWVLEANLRARSFYERAGFAREPGALREVEREGVRLPELRYRLPLG